MNLMPLHLSPEILYALIGVLGLYLGSFLNACIVYIPQNKKIVWPGTLCTGCKAPCKWYQNIPLLSFILLRGRCPKCKCPISWQYPLVELLTGALFVLIAVFLPWGLALFIGIIGLVLRIIFLVLWEKHGKRNRNANTHISIKERKIPFSLYLFIGTCIFIVTEISA